MSIAAVVGLSQFKDKDGGGGGSYAAIVKHRFLSFLIWQLLQSTFLYILSKTLLLSWFTRNPFFFTFASILALFSFHLSLLSFSVAIFFISSPYPLAFASPFEVFLWYIRVVFVPRGNQTSLISKIRVSFSFMIFVGLCAIAGAVVICSLCWACNCFHGAGSLGLRRLGLRGFLMGLVYGLHYLYNQKWVLQFPIVQRPPFFSMKMGLLLSAAQAVKFSACGFLSGVLAIPLLVDLSASSSGKFVIEQFVFSIGCFVVILCWELSHCLDQVFHAKRFVFAPQKGSAAAEMNPSESLLATLEESKPKSLLQYLAYLDLCMLCENNVDTWRRAAFFEETGETYKKIMSVCLRPLEQFTQKLAEDLEFSSTDKPIALSDQLTSPLDWLAVSKLNEPFFDSQLCAWCARTIASLTSRSRKEDRYGVGQITGSNAAVTTTLLSCLLAVETLMGKRTSIQSANLGPAGIQWATVNTGRRESTASTMGKIRGSPLYAKAYAMADILKASIYSIVYAFLDEMLNAAKAGSLEKDWIISGKPLYGSRELLVYKLRLFLDSQVS